MLWQLALCLLAALAVAGCGTRPAAGPIPLAKRWAESRLPAVATVSDATRTVRRLPPLDRSELASYSAISTEEQGGEFRLLAHSELDTNQHFAMEEIPAPGFVATEPLRLTLDGAIGACLQSDPVLRAGLEEIHQATADWQTASLRPNPELDVLQSLMSLGRPFEAGVRDGGPPQLDVLVSYPIDWFLFGKRAAAMLAAERGVRASESEYADLVRQRVAETTTAFFDVLETQSLAEIARQEVLELGRIDETLRVADDNENESVMERKRIRLALLTAEQALREAERDLAVAKAALRALVGGVHMDGAFEVVGSLDVPLADSPLTVEHALAVAEAHRPDIAAHRWRVTQAQSEIDVQRREAYPEIAPQVIYTRQFQERALGVPDVSSWGAGVVMELPLHDRNQGNRSRAASELAQAEHELRAMLLNLRAEITSLLAELEAARLNAAASAEQLQLVNELRDHVISQNNPEPVDVVEAQLEYFEALRHYINQHANYWRAVYGLNAALGCHAIQ